MLELAPRVTWRSLTAHVAERTAAAGPRRMTVGLLTGCVQRVVFPNVNTATVNVLSAEGCDVVAPRGQGCCGALALHAGRLDEARRFARRTIDTFERVGVDRVVVNAAGCGSSMKEYGHLLADDPAWADRARAFAARVRDVSEVLAEIGPRAKRAPLPLRLGFQDSCHLYHAQGVRAEPRAALGAIPELEVLEPAEQEICCGSAGIYNIVQPEPAAELGERKAANVLETGAEAYASANPGCLVQVSNALRRRGRPLPAFHPVELVDASIRGVGRDELLTGARR
jgi:glycolate oxidase iron-sulfur subunit